MLVSRLSNSSRLPVFASMGRFSSLELLLNSSFLFPDFDEFRELLTSYFLRYFLLVPIAPESIKSLFWTFFWFEGSG